ncbi:MAG TPA: AIR synthase-related protein, partial [Candidatus Acidoferrum sp.]
LGKSIYPTPTIGILGILEDANAVLKVAFRSEGDVIVLLDGAISAGVLSAQAAAQEFSSSQYAKTIHGIVAGQPPVIDLAAEKRLMDCLVALAEAGTVRSAHDLSDGGLAVALAESCFAAKGLGAEVRLDGEANAEHALFGERGARAFVSVTPSQVAGVLATARQYNVGAREIGKVTHDSALRIEYKGCAVIDAGLGALQQDWTHALERALKIQ